MMINQLIEKIDAEGDVVKNLKWNQQITEEKYDSASSRLRLLKVNMKKTIANYSKANSELIRCIKVPKMIHIDIAATIITIIDPEQSTSWNSFVVI